MQFKKKKIVRISSLKMKKKIELNINIYSIMVMYFGREKCEQDKIFRVLSTRYIFILYS